MKNILYIVLYFNIQLLSGQGRLVIVDQTRNPIPFLKCEINGIIHFTNESGQINFKDSSDTLAIHPSGYNPLKIAHLISLDDTVRLERNPIRLDEIIILGSRKFPKEKIEQIGKKETRINIQSSSQGTILITNFCPKKDMKLDYIKFFIERNSDLVQDYFVQPLLYKFDTFGELDKSLIEEVTFRIDTSFGENIYLDVSNADIELKKNVSYFIGFVLYAEDGSANMSTWGSNAIQNQRTLIRSTPRSSWQTLNYSINIELGHR